MRPGVRTLLITAARTLCSPGTIGSEIRDAAPRSVLTRVGLFSGVCIGVGASVGSPWGVLDAWIAAPRGYVPAFGAAGPLLAGGAAAVAVWGLSHVERLGVARRGIKPGCRRITPGLARQACDHASVAWAIGAAGYLGASIAGLGVNGEPWSRLFSALAVSSLGVGFLAFEVLVWAILRRCRFANLASAAAPPCELDRSE